MPSFSSSLEKSIHSALKLANERNHELATLEHLLLALIDEKVPVIGVIPTNNLFEKTYSNLAEVKARGGTLYVFSDPSISMDLKSGKSKTGLGRL